MTDWLLRGFLLLLATLMIVLPASGAAFLFWKGFTMANPSWTPIYYAGGAGAAAWTMMMAREWREGRPHASEKSEVGNVEGS